jgi:hypothetical protein
MLQRTVFLGISYSRANATPRPLAGGNARKGQRFQTIDYKCVVNYPTSIPATMFKIDWAPERFMVHNTRSVAIHPGARLLSNRIAYEPIVNARLPVTVSKPGRSGEIIVNGLRRKKAVQLWLKNKTTPGMEQS